MKRLRRSLHNQTLICEYPGVHFELRGLCLFLPFQHAVAHHVDLVHLGGVLQIVGDDDDAAAVIVFAILLNAHCRYEYGIRRLLGAKKGEARGIYGAVFACTAIPGGAVSVMLEPGRGSKFSVRVGRFWLQNVGCYSRIA